MPALDPATFKLWFLAAHRLAPGGPADRPALRVLCFLNAGSAESVYTAPAVVNRKR
eukprot:SAG22_NODE_6503_length_846_cov_0.995984_1_plen_56_part_00